MCKKMKLLPGVHMSLLLLLMSLNLATIMAAGDEPDDSNDNLGNEHDKMQSRSVGQQTRFPDEGSLEVRLRVPERRRVRQDIYNFYNSHQRPNYWRPRPRPRPPPPVYDDYADYDDASDSNYYGRPPYRPYYPYAPPIATTTTTTTTTPTPSTPDEPVKPIGYMLIDTYHTPAGSYSRPIAFFGN